MCDAVDRLSGSRCLCEDGHIGQHVTMGRDDHGSWRVTWTDPDEIRRLLKEEAPWTTPR